MEGIVLNVPIDKILPVTSARAKISELVDDVMSGSIYVLTRGGKPAVVMAPIEYIKKVTENNITKVDSDKVLVEVPEKKKTEPENLPMKKPQAPIEPVIFEKPDQQVVEQRQAVSTLQPNSMVSTEPQPVVVEEKPLAVTQQKTKNNNSLISNADDFWFPVEKNIKSQPAKVGIDDEEAVPVKIGV